MNIMNLPSRGTSCSTNTCSQKTRVIHFSSPTGKPDVPVIPSPRIRNELESRKCRRPSRVSKLPIEILDHIFQSLASPELYQLLLVNSSVHSIALRILYRSISFVHPTQSIACMRTLCRNSILPALIRELKIVMPISCIANAYRLLHTTLKNLTGLVSLSLELAESHCPTWILDDCTFPLKKFTTSTPYDAPLARFLDSQPYITELSLRGSPHLPLPPMPPSLLSTSLSNTFTLLPSSLPRLTHFGTIHTNPSILASVVSGRPVQNVAIPLFAENTYALLDALGLASCPIKRLSLISFDPHASDYLLPLVARRFPELEALDILILKEPYTMEDLEASGPLLSEFKSLKYLNFMSALEEPSSLIDEQSVAILWHKSCPSLKTIILPKGKVWFETEARWSCFEE